jgi:hypothetical protein
MRTNKILLPAMVLIVAAGVVLWVGRENTTPTPAMPRVPAVTQPPPVPRSQAAEPGPAAGPDSPAPAHDGEVNNPPAPATTAASVPSADEAFEQSVDLLVSPEATFLQKQAVWGQLRSAGQLGRVIAELEARQAADPASAEIPTQLGMAYLMNISTTSDVREQGIGGMKSDLSFDTALQLDPTNWEAGFLKASALAHWPDSMNMGSQVIQRFTNLIEQQESEPVRPEFVQTYVLLGDQYLKSGQPDAARQAWNRGLMLFPGSQTLAQRLNPAP